MEILNPTKQRLEEIEKEIEELKKKEAELRQKWEYEKSVIQRIQKLKSDIEAARLEAENFEREGNLEKVAEIRYSKLYELERQLKEANEEYEKIQEQGSMLRQEVGAEEIAEIVSKWTGIPVSRMVESEREKIANIEHRLHERVIGQDIAVETVSNAILRSRAGLQESNKPIGSFLFIGPTGVGKTELARSLAQFLFDDENAMVRIDMSEYMEKFSVSRLIGAPPGYVGYEEGGQLTEAVRRRPYSVVLLDEIEKAHTDVFNVLLQVLDDGRLTDGKGRTVNFRNTIIIMTSNIGTDIIQEKFLQVKPEEYDYIYEEVENEVRKLLTEVLRPEFLNRIDNIVLFKPLTKYEIIEIAKLQLDYLKKRLEEQKIDIEFSDAAIKRIAEIGYDPNYGARPLKRAIERYLTNPLAKEIIRGKFTQADKILVGINSQGDFYFEKVQ
ncbi:MAG TPA: AAA family ATPase [Candidatus Kapabacteria bacterium]|nr:AAA family ATPase [Candidatus Kapabacteria bacterium]